MAISKCGMVRRILLRIRYSLSQRIMRSIIKRNREYLFTRRRRKRRLSPFSFLQNKSRPFRAAWMTSCVKEEEEVKEYRVKNTASDTGWYRLLLIDVDLNRIILKMRHSCLFFLFANYWNKSEQLA